MIELSVVVISKNQAWNICRLLDSILEASSCVSSKEIILVDSASTDQTVELASRYPIKIVRLQPGQRMSPAIGRYVGSRQAKGEYVLFVDGDTRLIEGWLGHAVRFMRQTPHAGAVSGWVINLPTSAAGEPTTPLRQTSMHPPREVLWGSYGGGGSALYRRSVLEQVGTFNPYFYSDEEPELGLRIRHGGYRFFELDYPIVRHYNDAPVSMATVLSRRKRNFLVGIGQGMRYHFGNDLLWPWMKERWWGPVALVWAAAVLSALFLCLMTWGFVGVGMWVAGLALLIAFEALQKRSLRDAFVASFGRLLLAEGMLKGLLMKPFPPENFRADFEAINRSKNEELVTNTLPRRAAPQTLANV